MHISMQEHTENGSGVYAASCFYAFDVENLALIFKSDFNSHHIQLAYLCQQVGITIAKHTRIIHRIKGLQIRGIFEPASIGQAKIYEDRYPFSGAIQGTVYSVSIHWCKYTDNALGFGKKLIFTKN